MTQSNLFSRRESALGSGSPLFYQAPIEIVRGDGVHLFDASGKRYLDMYNNVACVGHANAHVVEAMARQQSTVNVHSRYLHAGIVDFAERLASLHHGDIGSVVFSCSGTEANEVALRLAREITGKRGVICSNATYHGNSDTVIQLSRAATEPGAYPEVRTIPFPQKYRPIEEGLDDEQLATAYLNQLSAAIDSLERSGTGLAALIFCSIFANEGVPDIPTGFMARAAEMVRAHGGIVIADEVQAGYGRTGRWWGYESSGFQPDVVVTGKPMGNGFPLAATAGSHQLVSEFRARSRYFNTCAATPLQAAVGMAVLDVIETEGLVASAGAVGSDLTSELRSRASRYPFVGEIRGVGLFIGIEMIVEQSDKEPDPARAVDIVERLKNAGYLTSNAGVFGNMIKIRPPLVFGHEHAADFLQAWDSVLDEVHE